MGKGRGRGGDEDEIIGGIICVSVLAFIGIILFAVSFGTVEPNEMALNYNSNILQLDSSYLYSGGRYFLGLGHSFITYPKTIQMQEHDTAAAFQGGANRIVGRTQDGLAVEIACSIQYKFHESPGALYQSYTTFGSIDNHKTALVATARGVVRDVAAQYTAYEFFQNRSDIITSMGTALNSSFYMQWADIRNFNLLNLELPSAFESAIERTINMEQDIQKATYEQNAAKIRAATRVMQSNKNAEIIKVNYNASAFSNLVKKQKEAQGITAQFTTEQLAYANVQKKLADAFKDFSNDDLMTYIWLESIEQTRAKELTVGVSKPDVVEDIESV